MDLSAIFRVVNYTGTKQVRSMLVARLYVLSKKVVTFQVFLRNWISGQYSFVLSIFQLYSIIQLLDCVPAPLGRLDLITVDEECRFAAPVITTDWLS